MDYSYNANLTFEERVSKITKEIITTYPFIDKDIAIKIASIELPIDDDNKDDAMFKRLSNILFFYKDNELIKNRIINEILDNYKNLDNKTEKINNFINDILIYRNYNTEIPLYK